MIRQIFNEVLEQEDCTPTTWRIIRIKMIHKKGDVEDAGHDRPICTLPALYKLFSTLVYNILCIQDLTSCSRKTREGSGDPTKRWTICWRQIDRTEVPRVGCHNVGHDGGFHEGI